MATPNLLIANSVVGKTTSMSVITTNTTLLQNSNSSNALYKVSTILISNIDTANNANVTVEFFRSTTGVSRSIIKQVIIPTKSSFTPYDRSTIIYLEEGDLIRIRANSNNSVEAICSYEEVT
jgi:hypothetical protein